MNSLAHITGKKLRRIYIVGGGSRNTLLNRLTEAATGLEVRCGAVESATIGNFAVQLAALEDPRPEGVAAATVALWAHRILSATV
jgi:rhamnulokinase